MRAKSWKKIQVKTCLTTRTLPGRSVLRGVSTGLQRAGAHSPGHVRLLAPPAPRTLQPWRSCRPVCASQLPSLSVPATPALREGRKWRFRARPMGGSRRAPPRWATARGHCTGGRRKPPGSPRGRCTAGSDRWRLGERTQANREGPALGAESSLRTQGGRTSDDELLRGTGLLSHGMCKEQ